MAVRVLGGPPDATAMPTPRFLYKLLMYCFPAVSREPRKSGGLPFALTDAQYSTILPVLHVCASGQKRDHSHNGAALKGGPANKEIAIRSVKSPQMRAHGDNAPGQPWKNNVFLLHKVRLRVCLRGRAVIESSRESFFCHFV